MVLIMNRKKIFLPLSLLFIFVLFSSFVIAQQDGILDSILGVFGNVNIPELYGKYGTFIDFLIYLTIFIGVAQFTLGKRFEGRGGKAIIIGMGLALAIALSLTQNQFGFSIASFGPVAAAILLLVLGIMLFVMIKSAGMNASGSGAIAIVVVFLLVQALVPNFFEWMSRTKYANIIYGAMWIAIVWAIIVGVGAMMKGIGGGVRGVREGGKDVIRAMKGEEEAEDEVDEETKEIEKEREVSKALGRIGKKFLGSNRNVIGKLKKIKDIIKKHGLSATGRTLISEKLEEIKPEIKEERHLENLTEGYTVALDRLKKGDVARIFGEGGMANKRIAGFLTRAAVNEGGHKVRKLPEKLLKYVANEKRRFADELRVLERYLEDIKKTRDLDLKSINFLTEAVNEIKAGNAVMAESRIDNAINARQELDRILQEEGKITSILNRLENHELRDLKNEKELLKIVERELKIKQE